MLIFLNNHKLRQVGNLEEWGGQNIFHCTKHLEWQEEWFSSIGKGQGKEVTPEGKACFLFKQHCLWWQENMSYKVNDLCFK